MSKKIYNDRVCNWPLTVLTLSSVTFCNRDCHLENHLSVYRCQKKNKKTMQVRVLSVTSWSGAWLLDFCINLHQIWLNDRRHDAQHSATRQPWVLFTNHHLQTVVLSLCPYHALLPDTSCLELP